MGDSRKGKSIWKRYDKPRGEARVESDGKLFYRIDKKTGRTGLAVSQYVGRVGYALGAMHGAHQTANYDK